MSLMKSIAVSLALACAALAADVAAREVPVADFFRDPEFTSVSLSPGGDYITVSKPMGDRTILAAFRVADMKLVGKWDHGAKKHIDQVLWVNDKRFLMYVTEKTGRFDFRVGTPDLHASNIDGTQRKVIPNGGTYQIIDTLDDEPNWVLVQRSVDSAFLSKLNVMDGRVVTVASAPLRFGSFLRDQNKTLRYAVGADEKNNRITLRREGESWKEVHRAPMGGSTQMPIAFSDDADKVYFQVSAKGEPASIQLIDPVTGDAQTVSQNPNVDPSNLLYSSSGDRLLGVRYMDGIPSNEFIAKDDALVRTYAGLSNAFPEHVLAFAGTSRDGRYVLFNAYSDVDPGSYYLFDREKGQAKYLLSAMDWIKPADMAEMRPVTVTARDGVKLHGYITLPAGGEGKAWPLILNPHGGPHGPRDTWRFNPEVQFLANRGYAVLQINFRGSGGYGNAFERMGYRRWGTSMIDDMHDAVEWAVAEGLADTNRVCVYGASYGGYAALQSVVRYPDRYRCTVGYAGLYSMDLWMSDSDVAKHASGQNYQKSVFPEDAAERAAQSPAMQVEKIRVPVMLVHGEKDQRVPISQFKLLKSALVAAGKPPEVEIVEAGEGHGFYDHDNQVRLYTRMQQFFDQHLGSQK
jgi:dipeptidyl aminopeptidase/acylaminoacyl peptidase